jgi:thioredoxin reductase
MLDALIVGAGPTGLTLAAGLARFGVQFRVIDRALERVRDCVAASHVLLTHRHEGVVIQPVGAMPWTAPKQHCRSFSGHERANYGREGGTDAREVAESQQVFRKSCLGERTLDQESPGSTPGGAMKPGNDLAVVGPRLSTRLP